MSGQQSTVARHPARVEIERQLRAGVPSMTVAASHGLSRQSMDRFKSKLMAGPAHTGDGDREAMMKQVQVLYNSTIDLMKKARAANAPRAFLAATGEARRCLTLMSKIIGLLNETPPPPIAVTVNVNVEELQAVILAALVPHPKARIDVAAALVEYADREAEGEK